MSHPLFPVGSRVRFADDVQFGDYIYLDPDVEPGLVVSDACMSGKLRPTMARSIGSMLAVSRVEPVSGRFGGLLSDGAA